MNSFFRLLTIATASALCGTASAQTSRTWNFELKSPGIYRIQVEHSTEGIDPGSSKVVYVIDVGEGKEPHEMSLVANRPYVPLAIQIAKPVKLRFAVEGLSDAALKRTSVHVENANTNDPDKAVSKTSIASSAPLSKQPAKELISSDAQALLKLPDDKIDVGVAALTLAKEIYPAIDVQTYSKRIDSLADQVFFLSKGTRDPETRIRALNTVFFLKAGFHYDHDPFARSKQEYYFLNGILDSKQGICYTMPLLYIAVAQRLGYPIYPVAAPDHLFARYVDASFSRGNIEVTSGGKYFTDESYVKHFSVSQRGLQSGSYMRTLSYREFLGHLVGANAIAFARNGQGQKAIAYLEKAVQLEPTFADHYDLLRIGYTALSKASNGEMATKSLQKAKRFEAKAKELGYVDPADISPERESLRGTS